MRAANNAIGASCGPFVSPAPGQYQIRIWRQDVWWGQINLNDGISFARDIPFRGLESVDRVHKVQLNIPCSENGEPALM